MTTLSLDNEFKQLWLKLTETEKVSLINVAKNYVQLKEETGKINIEQYNREIDEAMSRIDNGEFYTHEQAIEIFKSSKNDH